MWTSHLDKKIDSFGSVSKSTGHGVQNMKSTSWNIIVKSVVVANQLFATNVLRA